jgi:thiamine-phosphate pyrophosphorylase
MRLIIITPEAAIVDEPQIINSLFEHGLQRLHLRKPSFTSKNYRDYIKEIDSQYHSRVSIHGSFELFSEFRLGGIHLNSFSRDDQSIWHQVKDVIPSAISTSFHAWQEIEANTFPYGYVFISPVFNSISKQDYKAGIDLVGASKMKQNLARQNRYCPSIIGLGGVGKKQIEALHKYGFDGAAILGAVWQSENPVSFFTKAMDVINLFQDP